MVKLELVSDLPSGPRPEIVVVTGTFVDDSYAIPPYLYLAHDKQSSLPASQRIFHLGKLGLAPLDENLEMLRERIKTFTQNETDGTPPIVVGHSQGGLHAVRLAAEGYASAAVSISSPHNGVNTRLSRSILRRIPGVRDMSRGSDFIQTHSTILDNLPPDIVIDNIAATSDALVNPEAQFGGPISEHSQTFVDVPQLYHKRLETIRENHAPDASPIHNIFNRLGSDHLSVIASSGVHRHIHKLKNNLNTHPQLGPDPVHLEAQ